jgi:peptide/nickel transport system permease protein
LTAPPIITATAPDALTTATAPDLIASAPDLPDLFRPVTPRRGVLGFARRHPAIAVGGALVLAMLLIALFAPWLGTVDPCTLQIAWRINTFAEQRGER